MSGRLDVMARQNVGLHAESREEIAAGFEAQVVCTMPNGGYSRPYAMRVWNFITSFIIGGAWDQAKRMINAERVRAAAEFLAREL